jgi:hypothetical protein
VTNGGGIDPTGAADAVATIAEEAGLSAFVIAMTGSECGEELRAEDSIAEELTTNMISTHAYLGAETVVQGLNAADEEAATTVLITGRLADSSLYVGPMLHHFDWRSDDWDQLGQPVAIGHLLECACQATGGYFMEPGRKPVAEPATLANPYVEVDETGIAEFAIPPTRGGRVDSHTLREQLYYEIHDPAAYLTPDASADFTTIEFTQLENDRVRVSGGTGSARPDTLKVVVGVPEGYEVVLLTKYGPVRGEERARLDSAILQQRIEEVLAVDPTEVDVLVEYLSIDVLDSESLRSRLPNDERAGPMDLEGTWTRLTIQGQDSEVVQDVAADAKSLVVAGAAASSPAQTLSFGGRLAKNGVTEIVGLEEAFLPRSAVTDTIEHHECGPVGYEDDQ